MKELGVGGRRQQKYKKPQQQLNKMEVRKTE